MKTPVFIGGGFHIACSIVGCYIALVPLSIYVSFFKRALKHEPETSKKGSK